MLLDLTGAPVSVDTSKAAVARRALELGAELINDVTALRGDPELAGVVADAGGYLCLMHMLGEPRTMQDDPVYDDVVSDVKRFLEERLAFAVAAGVREELVCLDPGSASARRSRTTSSCCAGSTSWPRSAGRSWSAPRARARSAGSSATRGRRPGRPAASLGAAVSAYERGATIIRVHDVREHVEALAAARAVRG